MRKTVGERAKEMTDMIQKDSASCHPYSDMFQEFVQIMENEVCIPVSQGKVSWPALEKMFCTFGEWESFCNEMRTMLDEERFYQDQYEELEKEYEEVKDKYIDTVDALKDVCADIEDMDTLLEKGTAVDEALSRIYTELDKIIAGDTSRPKKVTSKRKKK